MKYLYLLVFALATQGVHAECPCQRNQKQERNVREGFTMQRNVAQYKGSDYANVVHVERGITLSEAFDIAESHPDIDYFVYTKGHQMVLEIPSDSAFDPQNDPFGLVTHVEGLNYCRVFHQGDTVFFKKEGKWLGTAPDLADAYFKR